mmetsp:Transcript_19860/g.55255  ORF Transcript_19860/g.55255 Transcript_19860/m.55255 type:complete len:119 (+) Transcript_19860:293-649(+)
MAENSVTYGLKFQARALAAQVAETSSSRWLVGTLALREDNEIQVVEYDPDKETLQCVLALSHPEEVWCLAPSIKRPDRFISVYSKGGQFGSSLWEFDEEGSGLTEVCELKGHNRVIRR